MAELPHKSLTINSFETELTGNILPFWKKHPIDREKGGFFGALSNDLQVFDEVERSAILCSRILWTFSTAALSYEDKSYLETAEWAYQYLNEHFWDQTFQGVYWSLDKNGQPVNDRKHAYAQAFSIYGFSAYYQASGNPHSLQLAQTLFNLIETHTFDQENGGYIECRARDWSPLADMRLSDKEIISDKSMNTLLHIMEAYSALYRVWPDETLSQKLKGLVNVFLEHIINAESGHQRLFFDKTWNSLKEQISYGHDIEASWLLVEAAETLENKDLLPQTQKTALQMAQAVYEKAFHKDGSITYEVTSGEEPLDERHWWAHSEAVVGFYNAYQLSGDAHFAAAAGKVWDYIQAHFVDRRNGDWFKVLEADGTPIPTQYKTGPWECPYHHARMCFEMSRRLKTG